MERILSLSRAAKLVGSTRGALQKRVQEGELQSFEGGIRLEDLARLYPDVQLEDRSMLERLDHIVENALQRARFKKLEQLRLPDTETLIARIRALSREVRELQIRAETYQEAFEKLASQVLTIPADTGDNTATALSALHNRLQEQPRGQPPAASGEDLLTTDTLLRLMMAQVHIQPSGEEFYIEGENSILESALSAGLPVNYGCSNGNCGKCMARLVSGDIRKLKPHDYVFNEAEKNNGMFLACCHTAKTDIIIEADIAGTAADIPQQTITAQVKKLEPMSDSICRLKLRTPRTQRLRFLAGQAVDVGLSEEIHKMFSIASCPCDDMNIELHIPVAEGDGFVDHLTNNIKNGDKISLAGPSGNFVLDYHDTHPLVLVVVDQHFAAIKSLVEHAMTLETAEFTHLYWLVSSEGENYLDNLCRAWADAFEELQYNVLPYSVQSSDAQLEAWQKIIDQHPPSQPYLLYASLPEAHKAQIQQYLQEQGISPDRLHFNTVC